MDKKYELTDETIEDEVGHILHRIRALKSFSDVKKGDLGGFIESEENLSQEGNCWVSEDAWVYEDAHVFGNAEVFGDAQVFGNAEVFGDAQVFGIAWIYENARVFGDAQVCRNAKVFGDARVSGDAQVCGKAKVFRDAKVCGNAKVTSMDDYSTISNFGTQYRTTTFFRCEDNKIRVSCGCFYGTIPEFRNQVKNTRKGKIAEEYLLIADLMEKHFSKR